MLKSRQRLSVSPNSRVPRCVAEIFTGEVLKDLRKIHRKENRYDSPSFPIRKRHQIFSAKQPSTAGLRAIRKLWWAYIAHASAKGILDDDLRGRLADSNDDNFRSALAECLVGWFFDHMIGVPLRRHRPIDGTRGPDFEAENDLRVEVKAPHVAIPGPSWAGDDSSTIRSCVSAAGKQFGHGTVNLVVVVPLLRTPIWMHRRQLLTAAIGRFALSVPVGVDPRSRQQESKNVFLQDGRLAKFFPSENGKGKTDLTRVSAVVTIEEDFLSAADETMSIRHRVHVVHNPFTPEATRLAGTMFDEFPQLVIDEDRRISWSDGKSLFP